LTKSTQYATLIGNKSKTKMTKTKEKLSPIDATDETPDTISSRSGLSISDDLIDEIIQAREHSDSTLIAGGALQNENGSLVLTSEQIYAAHLEMIDDFRSRYGENIQNSLDKMAIETPFNAEYISADILLNPRAMQIRCGHGEEFDIKIENQGYFGIDLYEGFCVDESFILFLKNARDKAYPWLSDEDVNALAEQAEEFYRKVTDDQPQKRYTQFEFHGVVCQFVCRTIKGQNTDAMFGSNWVDKCIGADPGETRLCRGERTIDIKLPLDTRVSDFINADELRKKLSEHPAFGLIGPQVQEQIINRILSYKNPKLDKSEVPNWREKIIERAVVVLEASRDASRIAKQNKRNAQIIESTLQRGDLVHGTDVESLEQILNSGILCTEALSGNLDYQQGDDLTMVETSFLVDFSEVQSDQISHQDFRKMGIFGGYLASTGEGKHPKNISVICRRSEHSTYDEADIAHPNDYVEKGYRPLVGKFLYDEDRMQAGVFIGVESTDIAAIVAGGLVDVEQVKQILVKNRHFIPVFDTEGNLLFSYEDYSVLIDK
jgi:hypothetical protein